LGIGTGALGLDPSAATEAQRDQIAIETVRAAIDAGINYIDTSPSYRAGDSDRRLRLALADGRRDGVVLATKVGTHPERVGDYSFEAVEWTAGESLRALGTDVIDVMLVHDPGDIDEVMRPGGALDALEGLKERGVIRAIGLGVQNHEFLRIAISSGRFDVIQSPYDYSLMRTTAAPLFELALTNGVGCINASPFQQGLLAGVDPQVIVEARAATQMWAARPNDVARANAIWRWSIDNEVDLRAMALQFCLRNEQIATTLVGPRTPLELQEILEAATLQIPERDWLSLEDALPRFPSPAPGGEAANGAYPPPA
jgi:aryl-alcohol dehydrogenase-like predicted oxidoreductase